MLGTAIRNNHNNNNYDDKNNRFSSYSSSSSSHYYFKPKSVFFMILGTVLITFHLTSSYYRLTNNTIYNNTNNNDRDAVSIIPKKFEYKYINKKDDIPSRIYEPFLHKFPCYEGEKYFMGMTPTKEGILFNRPTKVGSTTMTGILLRLIHNRAAGELLDSKTMEPKNDIKINRCKVRAMHGTARSTNYKDRSHDKSFLFSLLRHPTKRTISQFFHFTVSVKQTEPTDKNFINYIRGTIKNHPFYDTYVKGLTTRNYTQLNSTKEFNDAYAKWKGYPTYQSMKNKLYKKANSIDSILLRGRINSYAIFGNTSSTQIVTDILNDYNFIGITERMDESLIVLQKLLNLTTKEILYAKSARSAGSFSNGLTNKEKGDNHPPCVYIIPSFVSKGMEEYFVSEEWNRTIANDLLLYEAANLSLDRTIDAFFSSRDEFNKKVINFKRALKVATKHCMGRMKGLCDSETGDVIPPSNSTCYIWAEGCDHDCIDEITDDELEF